MSVLVFGEEEKIKFNLLKKHAEENVFSFDDLLDIHNKAELPPGDREGFSCIVPVGIKVVYTIEMQPPGKFRHVSISVPSKGKLPNFELCNFIISELGYEKSVEELLKAKRVYSEDLQGGGNALNILEQI